MWNRQRQQTLFESIGLKRRHLVFLIKGKI